MGWLRRNARHLPAILGVCLLIAAIYVVQKEFRSLKIDEVRHALGQVPPRAIALAGLCTIAAYGVLTFYDRLGTIYAGHPVSRARAAFASFCAYALSHNLGFAAVSGAAVRYRLYSNWGLTAGEIAKVVAFCSLTFGLGAMSLGALIVFTEPAALPYFGDHLPRIALYGLGLILLGLPTGYVLVSAFTPVLHIRGRAIELPHWRMALQQVALATVDVAVTAAIFWSLVPHIHGLSYVRLLAVYLSCYSLGLVATIPGGLGVFDGAMLFGLKPYLPAQTILAAILLFRFYYYIIPLFLAGSMFAGNELLMRGRTMIGRPPITPRARWSEPDFAVAAATGAVAICGFLLLCLGVLENKPDFSWIDPDFGEVASQAGQFLPSLIGAALLVTASGLSRRVNLAWGAALVLLPLGALLLLAEQEPLWLVGLLALTVVLVAPYRATFYRTARVLAGPLTADVAVPLAVFVCCVLALPFFERHVRWIGDDSFWNVIASPSLPNSLRASIAAVAILGLAALWRLLRPGRVRWVPWSAETYRRFAALGGTPPSRADGMVWGEGGRAALAFRRAGPLIIGLGDPVGVAGDRASAVWRLRDLALEERLELVVWAARDDMRPAYEALGLAAAPIGDRPGRWLMHIAGRDAPDLSTLAPECALPDPIQTGPARRVPA